jgi:hypothetical protein
MSSCNDLSRKTAGTPLGAIGRGLVAGAAGTLAMDVLWYVRFRRGGGKQHFFAWEFSSALSSWDEAPVPGQVGKRLFEGLFQKKLPPQRAVVVSNITHWAYGMLNGAAYAIAAESLGQPRTWHGLPFGASAWAASYTVLPAAGLYKPASWRAHASPIPDAPPVTIAAAPSRFILGIIGDPLRNKTSAWRVKATTRSE